MLMKLEMMNPIIAIVITPLSNQTAGFALTDRLHER
jgi:hypothetical protein